jgi:flagellar basal body-associated protein FliL
MSDENEENDNEPSSTSSSSSFIRTLIIVIVSIVVVLLFFGAIAYAGYHFSKSTDLQNFQAKTPEEIQNAAKNLHPNASSSDIQELIASDIN